jgi:general secretion pathway protein E
VTAAPADADLPAAETPVPVNIPYGFAKRFGVALLGEEEGRLQVAVRDGGDPRALIEVRRFLARSFAIQFVPGERFDRILSNGTRWITRPRPMRPARSASAMS